MAFTLALILAYIFGRFRSVKFSKYASSLIKERKRMTKMQGRMHVVRKYRKICSFLQTANVIIALSVLIADIYFSFQKSSMILIEPFRVVFKAIKDLKYFMIISLAIFVITGIFRSILSKYQRSLVENQQSAKQTKDAFLKNLLNEIGPEITDSLFSSIGQDLMDENRMLRRDLMRNKESANKCSRDIIVKKTYIESYHDFLEAMSNFTWCNYCVRSIMKKKLRPCGSGITLISDDGSQALSVRGRQQLNENTSIDNSPHDDARGRSTTGVASPLLTKLICYKSCLPSFFKHVEQLKNKLKEQQATIQVMDKRLSETYKGQLDDDIDFDDLCSKN